MPAGEPGTITVGSADFPESQLLAQIYGQALEAAGFDVSYELGIGSREAYYGAIEGGEVGLVPEYTGSLLSFVVAPDQPEAANVDEQVDALGEALPEGLEVLTPSSAEDKDTIVCTQEVVDELESDEPVKPVREQRRHHPRRPRPSSRRVRRSGSPDSRDLRRRVRRVRAAAIRRHPRGPRRR